MDKVRILSLDGGGMRGILTARILQEVETIFYEQQSQIPDPAARKTFSQQFELIAGTSTGSLLAAGISIGKNLKTLTDIYLNDGLKIFPYQGLFALQRLPLVFQYGFSAPKFSNAGLMQVVKAHIGEHFSLADIHPSQGRPRLLITSYDTHSRTPVIFKSWREDKWFNKPCVTYDGATKPDKLPLWLACVSSASAPTFLPAVKIDACTDGGTLQEYCLIDGGVCANNPAACAVAEGIRLLTSRKENKDDVQSVSQAIHNIKVLSIGTGDLAAPMPWNTVKGWGLLQWGLRIADVLMDAPSDIHDYVSRQIIADVLEDTGDRDFDRKYLRLQLDRKAIGELNSDVLKIPMDDARPTQLASLELLAERYLDSTIERVVDGKPHTMTIRDAIRLFLHDWDS